MRYTVYAALSDETTEGWVWIQEPALSTRSLVKIFNKSKSRMVYCEARRIDRNFIKDRAENHPRATPITDPSKAMLISEW